MAIINVTSPGTYVVAAGDVVNVNLTTAGSVRFDAGTATGPVPFEINVIGGERVTSFSFLDSNLDPNITVDDNADVADDTLSLITNTVGDGARIEVKSEIGGSIITGNGDDVIIVDEGGIVDGSILTTNRTPDGSGDDIVVIRDNASVGGEVSGESLAGSLSIKIGDNVTIGTWIEAGDGDTDVCIGDNFSGLGFLGYAGDDSVNLHSYSNGDISSTLRGLSGDDYLGINWEVASQETAFIAAAKSAGYVDGTDAMGNPALVATNGVGHTFSYGGVVFSGWETIGQAYDSCVCFARGTMIATDKGERAIEDLEQGDMVLTADNGIKPIRWIGKQTIKRTRLRNNKKLRPIRIAAGALGEGNPAQDLLVSPQHRVLVKSSISERMFGEHEVLIAAKHLVLVDGVDVAEDLDEVEYYHFLFDQHEIIFSNGALTESLYTGPEAMKTLSPKSREEIFTIFPELTEVDYTSLPARTIANGRKGRQLAVRHKNNRQSLVSHSA